MAAAVAPMPYSASGVAVPSVAGAMPGAPLGAVEQAAGRGTDGGLEPRSYPAPPTQPVGWAEDGRESRSQPSAPARQALSRLSHEQQLYGLMAVLRGLKEQGPGHVTIEVWQQLLIMLLARFRVKRQRASLQAVLTLRTLRLLRKVLLCALPQYQSVCLADVAMESTVDVSTDSLRERIETDVLGSIVVAPNGDTEFSDGLTDRLATAFMQHGVAVRLHEEHLRLAAGGGAAQPQLDLSGPMLGAASPAASTNAPTTQGTAGPSWTGLQRPLPPEVASLLGMLPQQQQVQAPSPTAGESSASGSRGPQVHNASPLGGANGPPTPGLPLTSLPGASMTSAWQQAAHSYQTPEEPMQVNSMPRQEYISWLGQLASAAGLELLQSQ